MVALVVVVVLAVAFDLTNGFHDSSNSIAAPVATRAMRPGTAVALTAVFTVLGPILAGTAVADTVGGLVSVGTANTTWILFASLLAAVAWNLATWWWGLPSSSSHALVGGLVGAAVTIGGLGAVHWGGFDGWRPVGVAGVLAALAVSPVVGGLAGWMGEFAAARSLRRAHRGVTRSILRGEWVTSSALAFAHGTNDAQKTMGLITLALVSTGSIPSFVVPLWVKLVCALALTLGTALGGWRIVRTLGRGIYRIRPLDGLMSQASSTVDHRRRRSVGRAGEHHARGRVLRGGSGRGASVAACALVGGPRDRARLGGDPAGLCGHGCHGRPGGENGRMTRHWFLPQTPDVMQTLLAQADITVAGAIAFASWAGGDLVQEAQVRACEHQAEQVRRELSLQLRQAFSTPVDQEDLFTLSERLDAVLNALKNVVREADGYALEPDAAIAAMASEIATGVQHLRTAIEHLATQGDVATREADAAASSERRMETIYREAMRGLLAVDDLREVVTRGEFYRRTLEIGERLTRVADRVWYAVVKEA